ncbi:MAG: hypothetical protein U5K74_14095 [Gemmatimonadaceae bacterium]|nr:hypothetical protein [Gemmatimonadaceae bacterium]
MTIGFAQTKILREWGAGLSHASVFWGFLVLTAGTAEILLHGVWPGFSYEHILPRPLWQLFMLSQELFAVVVLVAVSWLIWRRLVTPPKRLQGKEIHGTEAVIILCVIASLMITLYTTGAFEYAADPSVPCNTVRLVPSDLHRAGRAAWTGVPVWPSHGTSAGGRMRCWCSGSSTSCRIRSTCTS